MSPYLGCFLFFFNFKLEYQFIELKDALMTIEDQLFKAASIGDLSSVSDYHRQGADIHAKDNEALNLSSQNGHLNVVCYLVEHGVDIHDGGGYAVRWSAGNGHFEVVRYLAEQGADVQSHNNYALRLSAGYGQLEVVKYLVGLGADIGKGIPAARYQPNVLAWLEGYQQSREEKKQLLKHVKNTIPSPIGHKNRI